MQNIFHVAVLDDEPFYTKQIQDKIASYEFQEKLCIDVYHSAEAFFRSHIVYDILLLDIDLPGMDGIHLAKAIVNEKTIVIYVTRHQERMEEAFGINVFRYILKDKLDEKLERTLREAMDFLRQSADFKVRCEDGYEFVAQRDIIYLEYFAKDVCIYTKDRCYVYRSSTLENVSKQLSRQFVQINRSHIVNLEYVPQGTRM